MISSKISPSLPPNRFRGIAFEPDGERRTLTIHEEQIVGLICDGLSDAEIADELVNPVSRA